MQSLASGTKSVPIVEYTETDSAGYRVSFCSVTAQAPYARFSHEELRLQDYRQGIGISTVLQEPLSTSLNSQNTSKISADISGYHEIWNLPKKLISHQSRFFEKACSLDFKERREERISLPTDELHVFALFVEWLYYGSHTATCSQELTKELTKYNEKVSIHAKCWVLGDKLLSAGFKNYAMEQLYDSHLNRPFKRPVTVDDLRFVRDRSGSSSKLTNFFFDFVTSNFSNYGRVLRMTEEWDDLLVDYDNLRLLLFTNFRAAADTRKTYVQTMDKYLETHPSP